MSNMLLPTLFTTIVVALFIIVQPHALLAAQNNLALADGQCNSDPDYLGDLDPRSSTAQQNVTYLEHGLAQRDLEHFFRRDANGPTSKNADLNKPLPERPSARGSISQKPATVTLIKQHHTWLAPISVGTPPQSVFVVVEPSLSDSWVFTTEFKNREYQIMQKYDPSNSNTADKEQSITEGFKFVYRQVDVSGNVHRDTVTLGRDVKLMQQYFGGTTKLAGQPLRTQPHFFGGALGLNYVASSAALKRPSFMFNAVSEKTISKPIFAFYLSEDRSELHLGGTNKDFYTGDIQYYPTSKPTSVPTFLKGLHRPLYWFETYGQINVNEKKALIRGIHAAVDVRTYFIRGPPKEVEAVYELMGVKQKQNGQHVFPCDKPPSVRFQWGNREWGISAKNFKHEGLKSTMCVGIIQADPRLPLRRWVLGARFMMDVYTVFNPATQEIGFATLKRPESIHMA